MLVRYKKDLRIQDHTPLWQACQKGLPVLAMYVFENELMEAPDWSWFHGQCIKECLHDLALWLSSIHIPLLITKGVCEEAFSLIRSHFIITDIFAHQEIGNMLTYKRDIALTGYFRKHSIDFHEYPSHSVVRWGMKRDMRAAYRKDILSRTCTAIPPKQKKHVLLHMRVDQHSIALSTKKRFVQVMQCGETYAHKRLKKFLAGGYRSYLYHVGSPYHSVDSCSRLSHHLTYGAISLRYVMQTAQHKMTDLREQQLSHKKWSVLYNRVASYKRHLRAFISRLYWHDHFIQKLETETRYEYENIHPYYDRIRTVRDDVLIDARKHWQTGYPLIDAAMRCLKQTWWINFRMRAMIVSFICNTCMQDWRHIAWYLAWLFLDYEPWIHYTQLQMQAGTTWINQYRIYNPTKQCLDKDPQWLFLDTWIPELRPIPMPLKAEPWKLQYTLFWLQYGVQIGKDYPAPIVDLAWANQEARNILRDLKKQDGFRAIADRIYIKHGSRKRK